MPRLNTAQVIRIATAIRTIKPDRGQRFSIQDGQSPYVAAKVSKDGQLTLYKVNNEGEETSHGVVISAGQQATLNLALKLKI